MSIYGSLTKISNQKKLFITIDETQYKFLQTRARQAGRKVDATKFPLFTITDDDSGELKHFIYVNLDNYDKCNMRKFEAFLKKPVVIRDSFATWAFIPDGETEQICGVNFVLTSIRAGARPATSTKLCDEEAEQVNKSKLDSLTAIELAMKAAEDEQEAKEEQTNLPAASKLERSDQ